MTTNFVESYKLYTIGISLIDKQHRSVLIACDKLSNLLMQKRSGEVIDEALAERITTYVVDAIKKSFMVEEKVMELIKYHQREAHGIMHSRICGQLTELLRSRSRTVFSRAHAVLNVVETQLIDHISSEDAFVGEFYRARLRERL